MRFALDVRWEFSRSKLDLGDLNLLMKPVFLSIAFMSWVTFAFGQGAVGPVRFQPGSDVLLRAQSPSPGPGATDKGNKEVIGQGLTMLHTGNPNSLFWKENMDISGAGQLVNADFLWDGSSKILYAFGRITLRCTRGFKTDDLNVLLGIYGKRNFLSKPVGSGWWLVSLEKDQCDAPQAGLYGCKFSQSGQQLACGRMELNPGINDMEVVDAVRF